MRRFLLPWLLAAAGFAQPAPAPVISRVTGAADYSDPFLGVPRGGIVTIFGSGFAPSDAVKVRIWADYPMKTLLAEAPLLYVSPTQINAVLPPEIPSGARYVTVTAGAQESVPTWVAVTEGQFAPFTQNGTGVGPAVIQQYDGTGHPRLVRFTDPAPPGAVVTLWGTGLGPSRGDVAVMVAGVRIVPSYAGPAPGLPGVDQINFTLPANVPLRCLVPLLVRTGEASSGVVTVATGDGPFCESEFGLSRAALASLDNGGVVRGAVLSVTSITSPAGVARQAEAWMAEYDSASLSRLATADLLPLADPVRTCSRRTYAYGARGQAPLLEEGIYGLRRITGLLRSSCVGFADRNGIYEGRNCAPQYWFTGSLSPPPAAFFVTGNLPAPKPANAVSVLGVDWPGGQLHVSWAAAPPEPTDRVVVTAGSNFHMSGNIVGSRTEVRELTCQVPAGRISTLLSPADSDWARSFPNRNPVSVALTSIRYELFPPGDSLLDFVLVRARTSAVSAVP